LALSETKSKKSFVDENIFRYTGTSMSSTFKSGQVLYIRPTSNGMLPGDVVVFYSRTKFIVHRIKEVNGDYFITQGDNNPREDADIISKDQIIGVVDKVDDWGKSHSVIGGQRGLWIAHLRWKILALKNQLRPVIGAPYRWLKASHWINKIWHPDITSIQLQIPEGIIIKYIVRGKTVATWQPQQENFICRRPYDLIIYSPGETQ
jgi:hypothetical protein